MNPRPIVHHLDAVDLERAADDPRLGALAAQGWTVAGSIVTVTGAENPATGEPRQRLTLILWPPAAAARAAWVAPVAALVAAIGTWVVAAIILSGST